MPLSSLLSREGRVMRENTWSLRRRVLTCLTMSGVNLLLFLLPTLPSSHFMYLLGTVLFVNLAVCCAALKAVPAARVLEADRGLCSFRAGSSIYLMLGSVLALLVSAALETLDRQGALFFLGSTVLNVVSARVLDVGFDKRTDELYAEYLAEQTLR